MGWGGGGGICYGGGGLKGFISFSLIFPPKMWSLNSHKWGCCIPLLYLCDGSNVCWEWKQVSASGVILGDVDYKMAMFFFAFVMRNPHEKITGAGSGLFLVWKGETPGPQHVLPEMGGY